MKDKKFLKRTLFNKIQQMVEVAGILLERLMLEPGVIPEPVQALGIISNQQRIRQAHGTLQM